MVYEALTTSLLAIAGRNLDPIGGQAKQLISHGAHSKTTFTHGASSFCEGVLIRRANRTRGDGTPSYI